jgi:hypothetical protein
LKPCQSNINQSTQKGGNTKNKMEGPMSKKTKESPKRVNYKGNVKFLNPLGSQETYQIRKEKISFLFFWSTFCHGIQPPLAPTQLLPINCVVYLSLWFGHLSWTSTYTQQWYPGIKPQFVFGCFWSFINIPS